jgi:hypothetical protein
LLEKDGLRKNTKIIRKVSDYEDITYVWSRNVNKLISKKDAKECR